jgi:hypothetical protein
MDRIRVRFSRDDKLEGGGPPLQEWRWMDRLKQPTEELFWTAFLMTGQLKLSVSKMALHTQLTGGT